MWSRKGPFRVLQASSDGGRLPELLQGLPKGIPRDPSARGNIGVERRRNREPHRKAHLARNLKRWRRRNPAKMAAQGNRRRAFELGVEGEYTAAEFLALCERCGNACLCCGSAAKPLTLDPVVPLSLGGSNLITNIQPLCRSCNSRKNAKVVDYR